MSYFYHSLILSVASGVLIKFVQPFYEKFMARKRMQELELQFKDMLYCISASVAAGRQMQQHRHVVCFDTARSFP